MLRILIYDYSKSHSEPSVSWRTCPRLNDAVGQGRVNQWSNFDTILLSCLPARQALPLQENRLCLTIDFV